MRINYAFAFLLLMVSLIIGIMVYWGYFVLSSSDDFEKSLMQIHETRIKIIDACQALPECEVYRCLSSAPFSTEEKILYALQEQNCLIRQGANK